MPPLYIHAAICAAFIFLSLNTFMPPRKRPASVLEEEASRYTLYQDIVQHGTKTGLTNTLQSLQRSGLLPSTIVRGSCRSIRRDLANAQRQHCEVHTPYGTVCKEIELPLVAHPRWLIAHPLALLHYLSTLSCAFGKVMADCMAPGRPLSLVLYMDEITPGNPLRPEKSRTLQAVYWAFLEWPQFLLQRVAAWPCFGVLRSSVAAMLDGNMASLMKIILHVCFPATGHSLERGVTIRTSPDDMVVVTAKFRGFLADEKAHKEVTLSMGASGIKPCLGCKNVHHRIPKATILAHGLIGIDCIDPALFDQHSDDSVFEMADFLAATAAHTPNQLDALQTQCGLKYVPDGVLYDADLRARGIYRPVSHMIRDWMHVYLNDGVANCQCYELILVLKAQCNISRPTIQTYISQFKLPFKRGRVGALWLNDRRMKNKKRTLASFAGVMLSLVQLMNCFLVDVVAGEHMIDDHIKCFQHLATIIAILALGPANAMDHLPRLAHEILAHAALYVRLYAKSVKPKFHMSFHLIFDARRIGRFLSTFVTERKHRLTKKAALHVFRYIEKTVLRDLVNRQCQTVANGYSSLFRPRYMVTPKIVTLGGTDMIFAREVATHCGNLKIGDMVYLRRGGICKITAFWAGSLDADVLIATCVEYARITPVLVTTANSSVCFEDVSDIVDAVAWAVYDTNVLHVIQPFAASL